MFAHGQVALTGVLFSAYASLLAFINNKGENRSLEQQLFQVARLSVLLPGPIGSRGREIMADYSHGFAEDRAPPWGRIVTPAFGVGDPGYVDWRT